GLMPESSPYTRLRSLQYRGPSNSDDYNARILEHFKDLVVLYNQSRILAAAVDEFYRRAVQEQMSMERVVADLESRIDTLEGSAKRLTFHSDAQLDTARFDAGGAGFAVASTGRCFLDSEHGFLLLPRVDT